MGDLNPGLFNQEKNLTSGSTNHIILMSHKSMERELVSILILLGLCVINMLLGLSDIRNITYKV